MTISNYLENKILDKIFNNTNFTVTTPYISLHIGDPGKIGANEANGMSYTRQAGNFTVAFGGSVVTSSDIIFSNLPSGLYTHLGVWDIDSSGNYLWGDPLLETKTINDGESFILYSGDMSVSLS
jgi:hypothetical protein